MIGLFRSKVTHQGKYSYATFTENWPGSRAYIKGHSRRSTKPYYKQSAIGTKDLVVSVDRHSSTVTCSSWFHRITKQVHVRNDHFKMIPGAVVCSNVTCPRRLTTGATTFNQDRYGKQRTLS
ncbi:hypothetical protein MAM1_0053d03460 [Mucor ambiguus]|uniref:Uncharacterized protein n=1 Tax=Mucor ambiguus TaxID=91626 RepID=A0A0C9M9M4_9FUNG|nr:hypothetical protein MAM1_0053d03460 [Mucor ambiguus]